MAISLVHIGDFHAAPGPRNEARYRALDQLIDQALQLPNLGAWLWPGDLSHQRQAIADELALISRLRRMAHHAPVVIVRGNHDIEGDLDKFASVAASHPIYVVNTPDVLRIRLATMQFASIACLPYPHKAGLVLAGAANGDVVDAAADALDGIFMDFAARLEQARAQGDLTLFIGHVNVGGAITSVGQPNIGREIELSPRHLDRLGPIYKGLNHIHKAQEIHGAHYAGSICRLDFGEIEEKRWIEVQYDGGPSASLGYQVVTSHPLDVPPMYHVEGELTRDGFTWKVTAGPGGETQHPPGGDCLGCGGCGGDESGRCTDCGGIGVEVRWKGCEVRVRYTYAQSELGVLDRAVVASYFPEAALLQLEPIAIPDRQLRAPEVAAAKTLPDKVSAWCALNGTAATDDVLTKLAILEDFTPAEAIANAKQHADAIAEGKADEQKATVAA